MTVSEFRAAYRRGPYAWPGGYPIYSITTDGAALCFKCLKAERRNILDSISAATDDGWRVAGFDINWEDSELHCDHCSELIESAYTD